MGISQIVKYEIPQFYQRNGKQINILIEQGNFDFMERFKKSIYPIFLELQGLEDSIETQLLVEYGISGILMAFHKWYKAGCQPPISDFIKLIYSLVFRGFFNTLLICRDGSTSNEQITVPEGFIEMLKAIDFKKKS